MTKFRVHLLVLLTVALAEAGGLAGHLQTALTDLRFHWTSRPASGDIAFIAIDPYSIDQVGTWPWPRTVHGQLIRKLDAAGITDIVFDVDFSSPSSPDADAAFAKALKAANGSVVLPVFHQAKAAGSPSLHNNRPLPAFADNSWMAAVNVTIEPDGRVRRYPFAEKVGADVIPSMASVLAGQSDLSPRLFTIDFGIRSTTIPTFSYADVLSGDPAALKGLAGKKVLIGGAALELGDRFSVPNGAVLAGPLLQIIAAESIVQKRTLSTSSIYATLIGLSAIVLLMLWLWRRISIGSRVLALVALAVSIEALALLIQKLAPVIVDTACFQIAILSYLAATALDELDFRGLLARIAERRFHRIAMSLGDGVACADEAFKITVWNPAAEAMFGYTANEMIGQPFDTLCATREAASEVPRLLVRLPADLLQAVGGHVVEFEGRRKDGEVFAVEACLSSWQGANGPSYGASLRDISRRKREAERMRYLAEVDTTTELPNGHVLQGRIAAAIGSASDAGQKAALILLSVDNLQQTNMLLGQGFGDQVLRAVGMRLIEMVGHAGLVARLTGDELAILAERTTSNAARTLGELCAHAFEQPLSVGGREHNVTVRLGIALLPDDGANVDDALGNAHIALYQSKLQSNPHPTFYEANDRHKITSRLAMETELVRALAEQEFELFYQPQVSLTDRRVIGAEALIRWRHPSRGLVPPAEFIGIANSSPMSQDIASWVLRTACAQASAWAAAGQPVRIGVNLSPSQFSDGDLCDEVADVLAVTGLPPALLELEVTEDILLEDAEGVLSIVHRLQKLGVRMVFDDFGTGFGSLSYLKTFPLDGLKIDRSFVRDLIANSNDAAIVRSTISLGRDLHLSVIAEGIEDSDTAEMLALMGCQEGQGYFFGRPCPAAEFEKNFLLQTSECLVA